MRVGEATAASSGLPVRTRRTILLNLGLLAGSVVVALLLAEGLFRFLTGERVELRGMYTALPEAGVGLTPGFRGSMRTTEFDYTVSINELGMRDGPVVPKAGEVRRVLVIGDSFVFGVGVSLEESMPKSLEHHLRPLEPDLQVEVLNAGVPGYSPYQELVALQRLAPITRPDVVVQVVFTGDDWYGNAPHAPPAEQQGTLTEQLRIRSALYRFVDRFVLSRLKGIDQYEIHRIRPTPDFTQRMDEVQRLIERTRTLARAHGADFLVALCPRYSQVYDDAWAKASLVYRLSPGEYSPLEPNRMFAERLEAAGFRVMDLLGPLRAEGRKRTLNFAIDGHWNREGNDFIASLLAPALVVSLRGH